MIITGLKFKNKGTDIRAFIFLRCFAGGNEPFVQDPGTKASALLFPPPAPHRLRRQPRTAATGHTPPTALPAPQFVLARRHSFPLLLRR